MPDLAYEVSGGGKVQFPRRVRGGKPQLTVTDKLLYRAGKYGPTAIASGATAAIAHKVSKTEQTNPVKLPTNYTDWRSFDKQLDKVSAVQYIQTKENTMFKNPNFEVAFSDELHKIASLGDHDEALSMIKEGGPLLAKA